ncbi:unnamed protein product [Rangifer tarandus platyrhynchus]|uniref:Uncharacterized protein n=1 Tax=Rangifer tarandus platyrhynchus TaxID=3082113 RepID=A0ABN9A165_RANTA|nr:unnamed protein product [Rangifer tarandus platyrhynchus]
MDSGFLLRPGAPPSLSAEPTTHESISGARPRRPVSSPLLLLPGRVDTRTAGVGAASCPQKPQGQRWAGPTCNMAHEPTSDKTQGRVRKRETRVNVSTVRNLGAGSGLPDGTASPPAGGAGDRVLL